MMTKEEIAEVVAYCDENKISYKQRLSELGISECKQDGDSAGDFLQLVPGGTFLPNPIKPARSKSGKQKDAERNVVSVCIELRTPTGTMIRISGDLTGHELKDIIIASSTHV